METADGSFITSATFDSETGLGVIDLNATVTPEPPAFLLVATGLAGVARLARRRRKPEMWVTPARASRGLSLRRDHQDEPIEIL